MTHDKCPKCGETGILFEWGSDDAAVQHCIEFLCDSITKRRAGSDEWVLVVEGGRCITNQRDQLAERVKRLEEAGDFMELCLTHNEPFRSDAKTKWNQAKETKP